MRSLDLIPVRWLEYEPPGLCHTGIEVALAVASTAATIGGTIMQASAAADQAEYEAAVQRNNAVLQKQRANEQAALSQRDAISQERRTQLLQSRSRALAASSGTLATSPTQVDIESEIDAQGGYNALSSLYDGLAKARASNYQAEIDLFSAKRTQASIPMVVGGTLLSGFSKAAPSLMKLFA